MGAALAGLLILAVFITGTLTMSRTNLFGNVLVTETTKEAIRLSGERARTVIDVTSTAVTGPCTVTLTVDNAGSTSISDLSQMDVIAQFPAGNNVPQRLTHALSGAVVGEWSAISISGLFQPGIVDP